MFYSQGRVLGITIGCILGMVPLLFIKSKEEEVAKEVDVTVSASAEENAIPLKVEA